jgi:hypothetical protein
MALSVFHVCFLRYEEVANVCFRDMKWQETLDNYLYTISIYIHGKILCIRVPADCFLSISSPIVPDASGLCCCCGDDAL